MRFLLFYCSFPITILLRPGLASCQSGAGADAISFGKYVIGKHLSTIKDSLRCADADCDTTGEKKKAQIRSFAYINPSKNIRRIGHTDFSTALLFTDSARIIDNFSLMTSYNKTEVNQYLEKFQKDYDELLQFLRDYFKSRGRKGLEYNNQYSKQTNIKWKADGFVFTLTKDEIKKTNKQSDFYIITFFVFADKNSLN